MGHEDCRGQFEVDKFRRKITSSKFDKRAIDYLDKFMNVPVLTEAIIYTDNLNKRKKTFENIDRVENAFKYTLGSMLLNEYEDLDTGNVIRLLWLLHKEGIIDQITVGSTINDLTYSFGKGGREHYQLLSVEIRQAVEGMVATKN